MGLCTHFKVLYDPITKSYSKLFFRYKYDMFYLSPFYHLVFPLTHLIVMDTDTELKFNVELLYKQFSRFWSSFYFFLEEQKSSQGLTTSR